MLFIAHQAATHDFDCHENVQRPQPGYESARKRRKKKKKEWGAGWSVELQHHCNMMSPWIGCQWKTGRHLCHISSSFTCSKDKWTLWRSVSDGESCHCSCSRKILSMRPSGQWERERKVKKQVTRVMQRRRKRRRGRKSRKRRKTSSADAATLCCFPKRVSKEDYCIGQSRVCISL